MSFEITAFDLSLPPHPSPLSLRGEGVYNKLSISSLPFMGGAGGELSLK